MVLLESGKNEFLRELDKGHQRTSRAPLELQLFQGNISKCRKKGWHFWFNPTDELYFITEETNYTPGIRMLRIHSEKVSC